MSDLPNTQIEASGSSSAQAASTSDPRASATHVVAPPSGAPLSPELALVHAWLGDLAHALEALSSPDSDPAGPDLFLLVHRMAEGAHLARGVLASEAMVRGRAEELRTTARPVGIRGKQIAAWARWSKRLLPGDDTPVLGVNGPALDGWSTPRLDLTRSRLRSAAASGNRAALDAIVMGWA